MDIDVDMAIEGAKNLDDIVPPPIIIPQEDRTPGWGATVNWNGRNVCRECAASSKIHVDPLLIAPRPLDEIQKEIDDPYGIKEILDGIA